MRWLMKDELLRKDESWQGLSQVVEDTEPPVDWNWPKERGGELKWPRREQNRPTVQI